VDSDWLKDLPHLLRFHPPSHYDVNSSFKEYEGKVEEEEEEKKKKKVVAINILLKKAKLYLCLTN
jgi:hypothetical protein